MNHTIVLCLYLLLFYVFPHLRSTYFVRRFFECELISVHFFDPIIEQFYVFVRESVGISSVLEMTRVTVAAGGSRVQELRTVLLRKSFR